MEECLTINESDLDITLRDMTYFSNWMQHAVPAMQENGPMPPAPEVGSEQVRKWVAAIQGLHERHRQKVETQAALLGSLNAQEAQLDQVLGNLFANMATLYDNLGYVERAEEVRRRSGALPVG